MAWTDRARTAALDALRLNADDPAVRYTLALIYRGMGRHDDALIEVSRAIVLQPANDDLCRLRGRLHADLGRVEQGLADLTTAIRLRPGYWENHRAAGLVLYEAGRFADAVPHFRRVTELRPGNASAFQMLGTAHHAADHIAERWSPTSGRWRSRPTPTPGRTWAFCTTPVDATRRRAGRTRSR